MNFRYKYIGYYKFQINPSSRLDDRIYTNFQRRVKIENDYSLSQVVSVMIIRYTIHYMKYKVAHTESNPSNDII